jgi:hypothetical protein
MRPPRLPGSTFIVRLGALVGLALVSFSLAPTSDHKLTTGDPLPAIVFVSRNRMDTLNNYDVGPPVHVLGRELTPGGTLRLLRPDGTVVTLAGPHNGIFDVQSPMVSFDGTRVVFSGVRTRNGMWRIFEIGLDGSGLRQITPDSRGFTIPDDPKRPRQNEATFGRFSDFSPAYLPDGRIVFASSRYAGVSGSCGLRTVTLYVINPDGSDLRRIISTRSGAVQPWVMQDGRILFAMWMDNMNMPSLYTEGLQPLEADVNFGPSFFEPWACHPDGANAGRVGYMAGRMDHGPGGGMHFREMPNGEIVYTRRATASFLGSTLASAIAKFGPGDGTGNTIEGLGDPRNLEGPHALAPTPLPDGRILFSYTPDSKVWTDERNRLFAAFDFGLYVCDGDFKNVRLVYNDPKTDELDAVAVWRRTPRVLPDQVRTAPPEDPTAPITGYAVFENANVYADLDRRFTHIQSPLPGSVVAIDIYDDSQTFTIEPGFPLIRKQMPRFVASFPVNPDGSFRALIPADRPVLYFLRGPTGVAARYPGALGEIRTPAFGHEQLRPGEVLRCTGCHRGHMIRPDLAAKAKTNLARLAYVLASSTRNASYMQATRINDGHIGLENGYYQWIPATTDLWPWVRLSWEQRITAREIEIYPRPGIEQGLGEIHIYLSDGKRLTARSDPRRPDEPITVSIPQPGPIEWIHFQLVSFAAGGAPGIAEITVAGDPVEAVGASAPAPVPSVTITPGSLRLSWSRSPSRNVLGYKIFAGTSPDHLPIEYDVGNATSFQPEYLEAGRTYWFQIRPYDAKQFGPPQAREVSGTVVAPRIDRITPSSGPSWGGTEVTIEGDGFLSGLTVKIGDQRLRDVRIVSPQKIVGVTYRNSTGFHDVLVRNPGKQEAILPKGFKHE